VYLCIDLGSARIEKEASKEAGKKHYIVFLFFHLEREKRIEIERCARFVPLLVNEIKRGFCVCSKDL